LKYLSTSPPFVFILILGMSLLGILTVGISQADARILSNESSSVESRFPQGLPATVYVIGSPLALQPTPVSFPTLSPTATIFVEPSVTATPFGVLAADSNQDLLAFVHAPSGPQPQPYVILMSVESFQGNRVEIRGYENLREFICTGFPCVLPLADSSTVRFSAYDTAGNKSPEVIARVRVERRDGDYFVTIDSVSQFAVFRDACQGIWGVKDETGELWSKFPESPFQLSTDKTLYLLAARLIVNGIVDAGDCAGGGVDSTSDYATTCGVERAKAEMVRWQNRYDFTIWSTSLDVGIPPRILKSLIEYESQYWPSNQRFYLDEIGLGQINQLGVDVLLRENPDFYRRICPTVVSDCSLPYTSLEPAAQALVRGAVMNSIDAVCPSCEYGLNLEKASQSIPLIAQLLRANCQMVDYLGLSEKPLVEYDDMWKFTLAAYHSGYSCVRDAVLETRKNKEPEDWESVSQNIACKGTKRYVDGFWGTLLSFDSYLLDAGSVGFVQVAPTFIPTPTPIRLPTEIPSNAKVWVRVYMDVNGNGLPEANEALDGITVELLMRNGIMLSGTTLNGEVTFDMTGYPPNMDAIVSLPGLYREQGFSLPKDGVVQVDFVFTPPDLPKEIP
jgi:hypothetical protein